MNVYNLISLRALFVLVVGLLIISACSGSSGSQSSSGPVSTPSVEDPVITDPVIPDPITPDPTLPDPVPEPVVPDPLIENSTRVDFDIQVPALVSDALQVRVTWGEKEITAAWVGDEFWSVSDLSLIHI